MLCSEGMRRSGEVREVFPKVNIPACENTVVSKYSFSRSFTAPLSLADLVFGRCPGDPKLVWLTPLPICNGMPVR